MTATKYVTSNTRELERLAALRLFERRPWRKKVRQLKQAEGADLHVVGSPDILQTHFKNDLSTSCIS